MRKIRKDDEVIVITGKDKGKRGTVLRVLDDDRLIIENVNLIKKHQKPNPQRGEAGGIIEKEAAIESSNVMLFNAQAGKGDRVGVRTLDDGRKVRYFKSNGEVIDA
jgi:large subunit ribosomal protein L24